MKNRFLEKEVIFGKQKVKYDFYCILKSKLVYKISKSETSEISGKEFYNLNLFVSLEKILF